MPPFRDLSNQEINGVLVVDRAGKTGKFFTWNCVCGECGSRFVARGQSIVSGVRKDCGCVGRGKRAERIARIGRANSTHGKTKTPEWLAWFNMRQRCNNPNLESYQDYGARGVRVCRRWQKFENFLADMGPRPSSRHSLDRYPDGNGDYKPSNCRWATAKEQNRNRRRGMIVTFGGTSKHVGEWAEEYKLDIDVLRNRIKRGWDLSDALTRPVRRPAGA